MIRPLLFRAAAPPRERFFVALLVASFSLLGGCRASEVAPPSNAKTEVPANFPLKEGATYLGHYPQTIKEQASYAQAGTTNERFSLRANWLAYLPLSENYLVLDTYDTNQKTIEVNAVEKIKLDSGDYVIGQECAYMGSEDPSLIVIAPLPDETTPTIARPKAAYKIDDLNKQIEPVSVEKLTGITCKNPVYGAF
jgi:hypothetical protein